MAKKIKIYSISLLFLIMTSYANAGSVAGFGGSTEITQIMNNIQLMQSYVQQVMQVQNQISQITNQLSMYQNMILNTRDLIADPFQSASQTIMQLKNTIDQATQISYTLGSVDTYFQQLNPDYTTLFQGNGANFAQQQQVWRTSLLDNCEAALKGSSMSISSVQNDAQLLQTLSNNSKSAAGQKAAIQAANDIALEMAAKMGELKMLTALQVQTQTVYLTQKKAQEEAKDEYMKQQYDYDQSQINLNDNEDINARK